VVRRIFGPRRLKRGATLFSSSLNIIMTNKSERKRWTGYVAHMEKIRNSYTVVVKPERSSLLGRPRHGWEDDIKMDLQEERG
jgi:hypothetical protein